MYALEKREHGGIWRRCAVCGSRDPVAKVAAGLNNAEMWRVVYIPGGVSLIVEYPNAA